MDYDKLIKEVEDIQDKSDFIISWFAKKYQKTIFRIGSMDKDGCRTWEQGGKKYMCFWDTVLERYTTCIDPIITYRKARN